MGRIFENLHLHQRTGIFIDREDAAKQLAQFILNKYSFENVVVCAIPAGGVPIGVTLTKMLHASLMLAIVRKIQIPWNTESGFGAVSWDGHVVINKAVLPLLGLSQDDIDNAVAQAMKSIDERRKRFIGERALPSLTDKYIILTDDGLASGYTMITAIDTVRKSNPATVMVAVPTGSLSAVELVSKRVDDLVCLNIRGGWSFAVADAYVHWHDLSDAEVTYYLQQAIEMGFY